MSGIGSTLSELFSTNNSCSMPHTLIEMSYNEYVSMKDNSIHLEGAALGTCDGNEVQWYRKFTCGANVITAKIKKADMPNNACLKDIKIGEMKGKYLLITCNKSEYEMDKSIYIINSTRCNNDNYDKKMSGKLLLMYCIDQYQKHCTGWEWNQSICNAMKASKNNIITKENNCNSSAGHYYSYGNRGNFGMVNGSSVGQYTYKRFKSDMKTISSHIRDTAVQCISSHELGAGIDSLATRLPNIRNLISPIVDEAYVRQEQKVDINLKKVDSTCHGVWQNSVCVNAYTDKFHTESDCTSTVIVVPNQPKMKNDQRVYRFIFQL